MDQLGDLEKFLTAAREFGENQKQELDAARAETKVLQMELEDLRKQNESLQKELDELRAENKRIYIEMNNLRKAKENFRVANDVFAASLQQMVTQLTENHEKVMNQLSAVANGGLQKFVVDYVNKVRVNIENASVASSAPPVADIKKTAPPPKKPEPAVVSNFHEAPTLDKYSPTKAPEVVIVDSGQNLPANKTAAKPKMQYAQFYAEEAAVEADTTNDLKLKAVRPVKK